MCCCPELALIFLQHINLILAAYGGAALTTGARLKWDATTYVLVRELLPEEYRVSAVLLPALGATLLMLAHLGLLARSLRSVRLLITYIIGMTVLVCVELSYSGWLALRVRRWLQSAQVEEVKEALEVREHLQPLLDALGKWHPLPNKVKALLAEAEQDAPWNGYVSGALAALLLLLQTLAILLAVSAAVSGRVTNASNDRSHYSYHGTSRSNSEDKVPLKSVYRNGRLVMV